MLLSLLNVSNEHQFLGLFYPLMLSVPGMVLGEIDAPYRRVQILTTA